VSVRCTGGALWQALQWAVPACAAGVALHGVLGHLGLPAWATAGLGLAAAAGVGAGLATGLLSRWAAGPVGRDASAGPGRPPQQTILSWDGTRWTADGWPVQPQLRMDLGGWLLLQLRPAAPSAAAPGAALAPAWLAVAVGECGPAWHALRVALLAGHAPAPDGPQAHV
jgi:hypothetical protein